MHSIVEREVFVPMAVTFKSIAHEHFQSVALNVKDDWEWDVYITEKMDVVGIRNVVDDE
jgi:hypothetical protein